MIDKNELLFVVNENNKPLKPLPRYLVHQKVLWHRTSGIWVINDKKQILCQKRSNKKDLKPGFWEAFFGGHLHPNETFINNALRELEEELNIKVQRKNLIYYKSLKSDEPTHREFQYIFIYRMTHTITQFYFEKEEIDQVDWIDFGKVKKRLLLVSEDNWVHKWWDKEVLEQIEQIEN